MENTNMASNHPHRESATIASDGQRSSQANNVNAARPSSVAPPLAIAEGATITAIAAFACPVAAHATDAQRAKMPQISSVIGSNVAGKTERQATFVASISRAVLEGFRGPASPTSGDLTHIPSLQEDEAATFVAYSEIVEEGAQGKQVFAFSASYTSTASQPAIAYIPHQDVITSGVGSTGLAGSSLDAVFALDALKRAAGGLSEIELLAEFRKAETELELEYFRKTYLCLRNSFEWKQRGSWEGVLYWEGVMDAVKYEYNSRRDELLRVRNILVQDAFRRWNGNGSHTGVSTSPALVTTGYTSVEHVAPSSNADPVVVENSNNSILILPKYTNINTNNTATVEPEYTEFLGYLLEYQHHPTPIIIDSGASITLISEDVWKTLTPQPPLWEDKGEFELLQITTQRESESEVAGAAGPGALKYYIRIPIFFDTIASTSTSTSASTSTNEDYSEAGPVMLEVEAYVIPGMVMPFILGNDFTVPYGVSIIRHVVTATATADFGTQLEGGQVQRQVQTYIQFGASGRRASVLKREN